MIATTDGRTYSAGDSTGATEETYIDDVVWEIIDFAETISPKPGIWQTPIIDDKESRMGWENRKCLGMEKVSAKAPYMDHRRNSAR